jgi:hypothetical protein
MDGFAEEMRAVELPRASRGIAGESEETLAGADEKKKQDATS